MTTDLSKDFDTFTKKVKQKQYKATDSALKASANRITPKLPSKASAETLRSFANYRYSNGGTSRNLKYKVSTKKLSYGGYRLSVNLGKDQNLAHLFEDGFDLKQRYGYTRVSPLMHIDFEDESKAVVDKVVKEMNSMKGD